jgi:CheY-like chemotaxis protein
MSDEALRESPPDIILSDYSLPGFNGTTALALAVREAPDTPFIFVSAPSAKSVRSKF